MSEQDVDKLKKLIKALDDIVEVAEDVMEDGKVDFGDVMHLPKLAPVAQELMEVWQAKGEVLEEIKDLSYDELKELVDVAKE